MYIATPRPMELAINPATIGVVKAPTSAPMMPKPLAATVRFGGTQSVIQARIVRYRPVRKKPEMAAHTSVSITVLECGTPNQVVHAKPKNREMPALRPRRSEIIPEAMEPNVPAISITASSDPDATKEYPFISLKYRGVKVFIDQ